MVVVRRLLASSLLALFLFPFIVPMFGAKAAEDAIPVCCRRNGKHHCIMAAIMAMEDAHGRSVQTIADKCPFSVAPPAILVLPSFTPTAAASVFAGIRRHPSVSPQTEARLRVSFDRSRQKRGPPGLFA